MSRIARTAIAVVVASISQSGFGQAADGPAPRTYLRRNVDVALLDRPVSAPSECRVGWWQTMPDGHTRPAWGVRCR